MSNLIKIPSGGGKLKIIYARSTKNLAWEESEVLDSSNKPIKAILSTGKTKNSDNWGLVEVYGSNNNQDWNMIKKHDSGSGSTSGYPIMYENNEYRYYKFRLYSAGGAIYAGAVLWVE